MGYLSVAMSHKDIGEALFAEYAACHSLDHFLMLIMDKFLLKLVNIRYLKWGAAFTIVNGLYFYQSKSELPPLKQSWSRYISR